MVQAANFKQDESPTKSKLESKRSFKEIDSYFSEAIFLPFTFVEFLITYPTKATP